MPWYWNRWRRPWRRRHRFWTRRFRTTLRRRKRRRRRRVRKKLKFLKLIEWQPTTIRRCTVKGLYCLFQANHKRLNYNFAQYEASIGPKNIPGGGGYSLLRFTLNALFEQNELVRNVWTKSNKHFPFVRYLGCEFKIYRPEIVDVCIKFQNCYPMTASPLLYMGTQPSIMMLSRKSKKIPCKKTSKRHKPYVKYRFPPPQNMSNKWFFQKDIANLGLILIATTACSFDQYYISKYAENTTIEFQVLNTKIFQNRQFRNTTTTGYYPKDHFYLFSSNGDDPNPTWLQVEYLGNTIEYQYGETIGDFSVKDQNTYTARKTNYLSNRKHWGNPFHAFNFDKKHRIWFSTTPPAQCIPKEYDDAKKPVTQTASKLTEVTQELYFTIRYNPITDTGKDVQIYLLKNWAEETGWEPPTNQNLIVSGYPLWLGLWGYKDFQTKLGAITDIQHHYILAFKYPNFEPKLDAYIPLNYSFTQGTSEYYPLNERTAQDNLNWYPMYNYQMGAVENITAGGPGTAKLGEFKNAECHCEYKFHFKFGSCAPPMEKTTDPAQQPTFPIPNNFNGPNSLQSPEEPIGHFLYNFDERWGQITKTAAQRILKDQSTKSTLFTDTTTTGTDLPTLQTFPEEDLSSEEEETQKETLFEQLQLQRNKQKQLRHRIKHLLTLLQNIQ
nr:MAG: ORF1 [TTV-like mini virus]